MRRVITFAGLIALAGCKTPATVYQDRIKEVRVQVRAPCPEPETYRSLKAARPQPLRSQAMPATPEQRVARTSAQLGKFEAEGGWADRVERALDRCQEEGVEIKP